MNIGVGHSRLSPLAKKYVNEALDNPWFIHGKFTQKFERDFSRLHECQYGLVTNSGTSSLHVTLQALKEMHGWKDGDEVLVPAITFVSTANAVIHNRLTPVFVDVDERFYHFDPRNVERALSSRTRAMLPVHAFGQPCAMEPLLQLARKHRLSIIEDSCEAMFVCDQGKRVGSFGEAACFSMYVAHILTCGMGGIVTTNNSDLWIKMRSLINHGRDPAFLDFGDDKNKTPEKLRAIIEKRFHFTSIGHNFRTTEMEGAIALAQLEEYESNLSIRRQNAAFLLSALKDLEDLQLPETRAGSEHSYMMFPLILKTGDKTELIHFLESQGIETRDMLPLVNQPIYRDLGVRESDFPVARWVNRQGFYIGCHNGLTLSDLQYVVDRFHNYFRSSK